MAGRRDPGTAMDVDAHVALVREERHSCVQTHAHTNRAGHERLGQFGGGGESGRRCRECEKERVALGVDLHSVVSVACLADDLPVRGERLGIGLCSQFVQELRRPFDVGEEEGDTAGRKLPMHEPRSCAARDLPSTPLWRQDRRPRTCAPRSRVTTSLHRRGSHEVQIRLVERNPARACEPRANVGSARACPRWTGVCYFDKANRRFAGLFAKPSDGLEPSTPSLPSWNRGGKRGHAGVKEGTKAP